MEIKNLLDAIDAGRVRVTNHSDEEMAGDNLMLDDIYFATLHGEIIEDYPSDFPYPSCLVLGDTPGGVAVHIVWAYNTLSGWAVLVTVYRPDPKRWVDWRRRRART